MKKTKYIIKSTNKFEKEYRRIVKGNLVLGKRIVDVITQLNVDPFYTGLKTHSVNISGLGKVYSSRVTGDVRIVWCFEGEYILILQRIGGHSGGSNIYR